MDPVQRQNTSVESVVFRFPSVNKRDSSSSSTTGLLSYSQDPTSSLYNQNVSRTRSLTHKNRVIIHTIPSQTGSHSSFASRDVTNNTQNNALPTNPPTDWNHTEVFLPSGAVIHANQSNYADRGLSSSTRASRYHHTRSSSLGTTSSSSFSRASTASDVIPSLSVYHSSLAEAALHAPRISRTSSRRSNGEEWTRHHWNKIKSLEEASERARRCSKLSSGFAPLMVFGGLVFVCIGISASTNTGKDKERLKDLSAAPLAMGVFMITLGTVLIVTWFACRSRSQKLNQRLLHGSHLELNLSQGNLMQAVVSKLYNQLERAGTMREPQTPVLSGETAGASETEAEKPCESQENNERDARTSQRRTDTLVSRETSV